MGDRLINGLIRAYFTKTNLLLHVVGYPLLMGAEGGDFHLFLDGISIEAVFIGLMVGISTKQIMKHHHWIREHLLAPRRHVAPPTHLANKLYDDR